MCQIALVMLQAEISQRWISSQSLYNALHINSIDALRIEAENIDHIDRRKDLSYDEFFNEYLLKNKPVIICGLQNEHFLCTPSWTIPTPQAFFRFETELQVSSRTLRKLNSYRSNLWRTGV